MRRRPALRAMAFTVGLTLTAAVVSGCSAGSGPGTGAATVTLSTASSTVLHPAVGYGLLRVMTLDQRPNPRDVVIYAALPNELPQIGRAHV